MQLFGGNMDNWFKLHPKVKLALGALVVANSALAIAVVQGTASVRDLGVAVVVSAIGLVSAYFGAATPK